MIRQSAGKILAALLLVSIGSLSGCGGGEEKAAVKAEAPVETQSAPVNNPLAKEQALIHDASAIQGMLDKDADAKKKAIDDAMK